MGGSGGSGAVLVCLLLLLDRLLLGFRMLIIEETGTQEVLQLCDVRGGVGAALNLRNRGGRVAARRRSTLGHAQRARRGATRLPTPQI